MRRPDTVFQQAWTHLVQLLEQRFGEGLEVEGILLLIGIQEIGQGPLKLNKQQKMEALHVAVCSLLVPYGYYAFVGRDEAGWPHFEALEPVPHLSTMQQHRFIKEAILDYFDDGKALMEP